MNLLINGATLEILAVAELDVGYGDYYALYSNIKDSNSGSSDIKGSAGILGTYYENYKYGQEYQDNMKIGGRYVFVVRYEPLVSEIREISEDKILNTLVLYDYLSESWCPSVQDITDAPENYLETEQYSSIAKYIEITQADMHTFDMVYTLDMGMIPQYIEGNMHITDGREITKEDSANSAQVCVVSEVFAQNNNIKVGDKINMTLGTVCTEQYLSIGAVAATQERYAPSGTPTELEVVGIYGDTDINTRIQKLSSSYSCNTIFVPQSLLPISDSELSGHTFTPAEVSFGIGQAGNIEAFANECLPMIEAMGFTPTYYDGGWPDVVEAYEAARDVSAIRIVVLSAAAAIAVILAVYLFISRRRKDYAIMRALGSSRASSDRAMIIPLMAVVIAGDAAGTICGWIYASGKIYGTYGIPLPAAACTGGIILFALILGIIFLRILGSKSPLSLLQGSRNKGKK